MRRALLALAAVPAVIAGPGCTVGSGAGSAIGALYVQGCNFSANPVDLGTAAVPACFDLSPTFFAGVPFRIWLTPW